MKTPHNFHRRILVIDDNRAIHEDFRKILVPDADEDLDAAEASIFGESFPVAVSLDFELESAFQGEEGITLVKAAVAEGRPYSVAFVDVRMPPGIDGVEAAAKLWEIDPALHVVICTAYSDYSWQEMVAKIHKHERLLIVKKPFDAVEVLQLAHALTEKWRLENAARSHLDNIEQMVAERTRELVAANQQMREQAALLDIAKDAIFVWDLNKVIRFWNKSSERLYGWSSKEAIGANMDSLLVADRSEAREAIELILRESSWIGELHQRDKNGREITVECHWTLVRDELGTPISVLSMHTDVTERNLLKAQIIRAQRLESIGTLAAGIAHDLNNNLSPIVMAIEILKLQIHDPIGMELLETIEASASHGADLVRQVLSFAKGVGGERVALQPKYLVREVAKIAEDTFPRSIEVLAKVSPELWNVIGDSTQLHQVLLNLCVNARDAIPDNGSIVISASNVWLDDAYVTMNPEASAGPYVLIEVRDTGGGISGAILEKIFDPFFTTKEFGKGTGLGLATSLGIVKSHGGFIRVESEEGKGATFQIHLPACNGSHPSIQAQEAPLVYGNGELVLLIDDEKAILTVTQHAMESFGYRVITASNGADAVSLYAQLQNEIAVVLTDTMMPVMDGQTTMAVLRRMNPDVKIIAASGLKISGQYQGASIGGTPYFLAKPYTAEAMLKMLAEVLSQSSPALTSLKEVALPGEFLLPSAVA